MTKPHRLTTIQWAMIAVALTVIWLGGMVWFSYVYFMDKNPKRIPVAETYRDAR